MCTKISPPTGYYPCLRGRVSYYRLSGHIGSTLYSLPYRGGYGEGSLNLMSIPYSLILRQAKPGKPEEGNKTYAQAQYAQVLSINDMAKHMSSHGSKYSKGDILAVVTQLVECLREQILLGNRVELGDLGTFYASIIGKAAPNAESWNTSLIEDVKVRWAPSRQFESLINDATFIYVGSRKAQAEARKAEKLALNDMATIKPGEEPDEEPDDNGGGSTPGGGTDPDDGGNLE